MVIAEDDLASWQVLQAIGRGIREARASCGLSQAALSRKLGISPAQMCKHEAGLVEMPLTRLVHLCDIFRVPLFSFVRSAVKHKI